MVSGSCLVVLWECPSCQAGWFVSGRTGRRNSMGQECEVWGTSHSSGQLYDFGWSDWCGLILSDITLSGLLYPIPHLPDLALAISFGTGDFAGIQPSDDRYRPRLSLRWLFSSDASVRSPFARSRYPNRALQYRHQRSL